MHFVFFFILLGLTSSTKAQCVHDEHALSPRIANYEIIGQLDTAKKSFSGIQKITWVNSSPDSLSEVRLYMYVNAFKNTHTTFLRETEGNIFGEPFTERDSNEWGYQQITGLTEVGAEGNRVDELNYIQPSDGNNADETVILYPLSQELLPGDTLHLELQFISKLPRLLVRTGWSRDHFYHFTHWFPQMGVYQKENGDWKWNCHQFHRRTEFFSDFGSYMVTISAPENLIIEGSGCKTAQSVQDGMQTITFDAKDVIDFAWVAYPYFEVSEDSWKGVDIRMVITQEHANLIPRLTKALKFALEYLEDNVGTYPYPTITVMDPPIHALRSGFMEYPSYITLGSFRYFPEEVRSIESLLIHEFTHQYFMAVLASNEKEEAWLDEGFVTYYEDRIMEALFGEHASLVEWGVVKIANSALSRDEYVRLPDPEVAPPALPGWEIPEAFKGLVYAKTATTLRSIDNMVGRPVFDKMVQRYYQRWQFKHPTQSDWTEVMQEVLDEEKDGIYSDSTIMSFFNQLINGTDVCDFSVSAIYHNEENVFVGWAGEGDHRTFKKGREARPESTIIVRRLGDIRVPVEVEVIFEDGSHERWVWEAEKRRGRFDFKKRVETCIIDPDRRLFIDINLTNNCLSRTEQVRPVVTASAQFGYWVQNILQALSFLI